MPLTIDDIALAGLDPPKPPPPPPAPPKTDLIAELKMSKDIAGVKKMKVERAKLEDLQANEVYSEVTRQFTARNYVDQPYHTADKIFQVPERDNAGNIIPDWKRQMLAKKAAEKAKKEFEERLAREAEDRRLSSIPKWKRDLIARKEEAENKLKSTIYTPKVEELQSRSDTWRTRITQRAMSIDNISSFVSESEPGLMPYNKENQFDITTNNISGNIHFSKGNEGFRKSVNGGVANTIGHQISSTQSTKENINNGKLEDGVAHGYHITDTSRPV
uniref:WH2 domain-containing protein n=1 Tax=Anopheles epiroticus TaxID=199890 RepID=A0A182PWD3_9DIPT